MNMLSHSGAPFAVITIFIWLLSTKFIPTTQTDVDCLRAVKASLRDPLNSLSSWSFTNDTESSICDFMGVECWHNNDNKVLTINLASMGLEGEFPLGFSSCTSMTQLNLSSNNLCGQIPSNMSHIIGFITKLDLSYNRFSGEIPLELANCTYLNTLKLDNNRLTGQIPLNISQISRMDTFSVTNNQLSGPVPLWVSNLSKFGEESYGNNPGLCGWPSRPCLGPPVNIPTKTIIGAAVGGVAVMAFCFTIGMFIYLLYMDERRRPSRQ